MKAKAATASISSGESTSRKRYIVSRQVQNESRPAGPRRSASPAMARWKVWLCRFDAAGSSTATRSSPARGACPASTESMRPVSSTPMRTVAAQPCGSSACSAKIDGIGTPLTGYVYT